MNRLILLKNEIQNFINANLNSNVSELALKKNPFSEISYTEIIEQIAAKQKAKNKLPTWFATEKIIYPSKVSVEQTSSEKTAEYKASLVHGDTLIDLSGGFGIDDFYFAKSFNKVFHCEINEDLSQIVQHNYKQLNTLNIECLTGNSTDILKELNQKFDCIYVDPSRRNDEKGKVFMLKDCEPNVPKLLDFYFTFSKKIIIKTAPILDIQAGLSELKFVKNIHIVALENEVKELLWEIEFGFTGEISIITINIEKENIQKSKILINDDSYSKYSLPQNYLYEPNASLLKSGKFESIGILFNVNKLHQHSHLFTSENLVDFQGRRFKIVNSFPFDKETGKNYLLKQKMNIATRNFPLKPEEIKKKFKIVDGGTVFAFFTTNIENQKIILFCEKI